MPQELRKSDLNPDRFEEVLESAARGTDYRIVVPGAGVVRILPEPAELPPDKLDRFFSHPAVMRRLDQGVKELDAGEGIPDEEMDDVFNA